HGLMLLIAVMATTSCSTPIESRAAANYTGQPSRILVAPVNQRGMHVEVWRRFLDNLDRSLESCGVSIVKLPAGLNIVGGPITINGLDADAQIQIMPV